MPVRPVLMSDLRKTPPSPTDKHKMNVGKGNYNRFEALSHCSRSFSYGKRQLNTDEQVSTAKLPKLNSDQIFKSLADQDEKMTKAKDTIKEIVPIFNNVEDPPGQPGPGKASAGS